MELVMDSADPFKEYHVVINIEDQYSIIADM